MTTPRATRAAAAASNAGVPSAGVGKTSRRKGSKRAPRPQRPPMGALAAAARELHAARPGRGLHAPIPLAFSQGQSQPEEDDPPPPAAVEPVLPVGPTSPAGEVPSRRALPTSSGPSASTSSEPPSRPSTFEALPAHSSASASDAAGPAAPGPTSASAVDPSAAAPFPVPDLPPPPPGAAGGGDADGGDDVVDSQQPN